MGRQIKREDVMKVNTRRLNANSKLACMEELNAYLACLASFGPEADKTCAPSRKQLSLCAATVARQPRVTNTINYHLQRISRLMK